MQRARARVALTWWPALILLTRLVSPSHDAEQQPIKISGESGGESSLFCCYLDKVFIGVGPPLIQALASQCVQ